MAEEATEVGLHKTEPLSVGSGAGDGQTGTGSGGAEGGAAPWYGADSQYGEVGKRFENPDAALKSYQELEGAYTRSQQASAASQKWIEEYINPIFGGIDGYQQWLDEQAAAGGDGTGDAAGAGTQEGQPQAGQELAAMGQRVDQATSENRSQVIEQASDIAVDRFLQDYPEAEEQLAKIDELMKTGQINIPKPHLPTSHYQALVLSWGAVQSAASPKREAGLAAGGVAGGDAGEIAAQDEDAFEAPLDTLRGTLIKRAPPQPVLAD